MIKGLDIWWCSFLTSAVNGAEDYITSDICEISGSHGGEYEVQNCLLGCTAM
jgi:hypothetical protein